LTPGPGLRENIHMRTALKSTALQVALVAMVLRALLPAGWMPAAITSADASPFVICTIDGPLHQAPSKQTPPSDHDRAHAPCVFAAAAPLASPHVDAATLAPSNIAAPILFAASRDDVTANAIFRPNTARAPPSLV
jgi:hypothetical protein